MKRYYVYTVILLSSIAFAPVICIENELCIENEQGGLVSLGLTTSAAYVGYEGGKWLLEGITNSLDPQAIAAKLTQLAKSDGIKKTIGSFLIENKDWLTHPLAWGAVGAAVLAKCAYQYTPASCLKEYRSTFENQNSANQNFENQNVDTAAIAIVDAVTSNSWLLPFYKNKYSAAKRYIDSLRSRCEIARWFGCKEALSERIRQLEGYNATIKKSTHHKYEIDERKVQAQENQASAQGVIAHAAHGGDTISYAKSKLLNEVLNVRVIMVGLCCLFGYWHISPYLK